MNNANIPCDKKGRPIRLGDTFFVPCDCDGLQFIGVVTEARPEYIEASTMSVGDHTANFHTHAAYEPTDIVVLCSIEDTRDTDEAFVEALEQRHMSSWSEEETQRYNTITGQTEAVKQ